MPVTRPRPALRESAHAVPTQAMLAPAQAGTRGEVLARVLRKDRAPLHYWTGLPLG